MKRELSQAVSSPSLAHCHEANAVREQVARILASPSFRSSKRYTDFLRYTVEHTISGETENIKERVLGVEVFGRDPSYDTSADPVVRISAVEVRKRLQQYYRLHGQSREIRIDFPRGTYVPEFVWPVASPTSDSSSNQTDLRVKGSRKKWLMVMAGLASIGVVALAAWTATSPRQNPLERFWSPVTESPHPVLLCIPDRFSARPELPEAKGVPTVASSGRSVPLSTAYDPSQLFDVRNHVFFVDTLVVARIAATLGKQGRPFRLFHTEDATLDDLEQGPVVLIGGTNNPWIAKVSSSLRFGLAKDGLVDYISDRQYPSSQQWAITGQNSDVDYAVISRITNNVTGQPIVIVAGLHSMGTEAAGECFSDSECFAEAEKLAPGDWRHANLQFVIETKVINEVAGEPRVIAAYLSR
jgi:hypothetical protein